MRLDTQQSRRIGEHGPWVRLGETFALEELEVFLRVAACHVRVGLTGRRHVAEVVEAIDHLLRRAAADAQLEPAACDEVGRARVLDHVIGVLVAHVDHGGADLDSARSRADGRQERKWRRQLTREVVHAEIGAVCAKLLGGHGKVYRLKEASDPVRTSEYGVSDQ